MPDKPHSLITGTRITGLGTLASRVLGMIRDMATAALFGMSHGGVMDAFVTAFRIPNTFRRLFGEGALAASFLPVLAGELEKSRAHAWRLTSVLLTLLAVILTGVVLAIEVGCLVVAWMWDDAPGMKLVVGLTAVMMPYMLFMCLAAQAAATLQALEHFTIPALAPTLLNLCWLAAVWFVAPLVASDKEAQAYAVAVAVLAAGVLQLAAQLAMLRRFGFRYSYNWHATRDAIRSVFQAVVPMTLGLAITQINTLVDSLIAWGLAAAPDGPQMIPWLGSVVRYPLTQGAASSIYYGERLYEFPMAILGIAVATAIYPLLSRHAARGDHHRLARDLSLGLRLVLFLGVPAALGLWLLAQPLARLLFERGQFTPDDTLRAARVIGCYAMGVWAFCAAPVIVRGYYSVGDRATPVKTGAVMVALNLTLNLVLVWPLAEAGLAVSTTVCAILQAVWLLAWFSRHKIALDWPALAATAVRTLGATAIMGLACYALLVWMGSDGGNFRRLLQVAVPTAAGLVVYLGAHRLLGGQESRMLLTGLVERK